MASRWHTEDKSKGVRVYVRRFKTLSCLRLPSSTMDFLFDFNNACMNEKSHHSADVSATRGDKQGRAAGESREGRRRKRRVCLCVWLSHSFSGPRNCGRLAASRQASLFLKNHFSFFHVSASHVGELTYFYLNWLLRQTDVDIKCSFLRHDCIGITQSR